MNNFIDQTGLILYSFRRCPYAMRARMALYASGLTVELREIELKNKPAAMLAASPKGTVPVLVLPDGAVIDESRDIMIRALHENDPQGWLTGDQNTCINLIDRNDTAFKSALDRYKYPNRYPDEDCSGARDQCAAILSDLNERLGTSPQLLGDTVTMADIALFPFIRQCAFVDKDWFDTQDWPYLQRWLAGHLDSPLFAAIMKKYKPWQEGDEPISFGVATP